MIDRTKRREPSFVGKPCLRANPLDLALGKALVALFVEKSEFDG